MKTGKRQCHSAFIGGDCTFSAGECTFCAGEYTFSAGEYRIDWILWRIGAGSSTFSTEVLATINYSLFGLLTGRDPAILKRGEKAKRKASPDCKRLRCFQGLILIIYI